MNIYIAGHRGMVGSAIVRKLTADPENKIIQRTHAELDLTNQAAAHEFIGRKKIDQIYLAAAKVGGIHANHTYPADFIYQNLMIQSNIINAAYKNNIQKLLFLGSSCIYPREVKQPIREDALLTGRPDPTNEPYAIAKIAGIKLCESYNRQHNTDFRSVMPTNLYGPGDNYDLENGHVIPALIHRFHEAKLNNTSSVIVWGTGTPKREFLYVD
ncbi:MAG: GDP-L-fucose synthase, partial [Candidatus Poribacteria bacterium]|nr:GDP-L-fucose synthase [Candidatus Poribacteria bacterium]